MLEALIALTPILLMFLAVCQTCDLYAHQLIVQRAAAAAARAAVVILPDDGARYGDPGQRSLNRLEGERKRAIEAAASGLLRASQRFAVEGSRVQVTGRFQPGTTTHVQLEVDYHCLLRALPLVCGTRGQLRLHAAAALTYQGARYLYRKRG